MPSLLPTPEPADPVEGQPGHFEHSNWLKASVKALDIGVVHKDGDTMTGPLVLNEGGTQVVNLTPEVYGEVPSLRVGATDNPVGTLAAVMGADPTSPYHLTNKGYVDSLVAKKYRLVAIPTGHLSTGPAGEEAWKIDDGIGFNAKAGELFLVSGYAVVASDALNTIHVKVDLGQLPYQRVCDVLGTNPGTVWITIPVTAVFVSPIDQQLRIAFGISGDQGPCKIWEGSFINVIRVGF